MYLMTSARDQTLTSETPKDNTVFRRVAKNSFISHSCRGKMNINNTIVIKDDKFLSLSELIFGGAAAKEDEQQ